MITTTRPPILDLVNLDPCGIPTTRTPVAAPPAAQGPILPGLAPHSMLALVQRIQPPLKPLPLAWGIAEGRTIAFQVDDRTAAELQAALDLGEEPIALVEPTQLVAMDIGPEAR